MGAPVVVDAGIDFGTFAVAFVVAVGVVGKVDLAGTLPWPAPTSTSSTSMFSWPPDLLKRWSNAPLKRLACSLSSPARLTCLSQTQHSVQSFLDNQEDEVLLLLTSNGTQLPCQVIGQPIVQEQLGLGCNTNMVLSRHDEGHLVRRACHQQGHIGTSLCPLVVIDVFPCSHEDPEHVNWLTIAHHRLDLDHLGCPEHWMYITG